MVVTAAAIIVCLLLLLFFFYRPGGVKSLLEHSNAELQVGGQQTASTASESVRLPGNESHESGWQGGTEANDTIINDVPMVVYTPHYTKVVLQMGTPDIKDSTIESHESGWQGGTEANDTIINDVPMVVYTPHYTKVVLQMGTPDIKDSTIVYIAQAADVRADNQHIVGAFVLEGTPLSWGVSKEGYCAIINQKIHIGVYIAQAADVRADNQHIVGAFVLEGTPLSWGVSKEGYCAIINQKIHIGVSDNTALFEEATAKEGYFFRQYPLVSNGIVCENKPKGKALRRAICQQGSQIFMVHSVNRESFHDFAQALVDLGCTQAIYLVGSDSYGWCVNPKGESQIFMVHSVNRESFHDFAQALVDLGCTQAIYLVGSDSYGWCVNPKGERLTWGNRNRLNASTPSTSYIVFRK